MSGANDDEFLGYLVSMNYVKLFSDSVDIS